MTIYDMVRANMPNAKNKGEGVMWTSLKRLSDVLVPMMDAHPEEYWALLKGMYYDICGGHYNEMFADWQIAQMYYKDDKGVEHKAPYWTHEKARDIYNTIKSKIPSQYNEWDWDVTLSMIYSDDICMFRKWWEGASDDVLMQKVIEASVNYLADVDDKTNEKIWNRFNNL